MKAMWLTVPAIVAVLAAGTANANEELAKKMGCFGCHSIDKKVVGPAWHDIGAKYKADPAAKETLIKSVRSGSKGKWGTGQMPPQKKPTDDELKTLVDFILTL
ncbi:MAG: cytochrome C-551 [Gammaproteobacteria bacterium RBG_16_57_12]|nr:MAG: cytochrome C-551 [Gammaproteobacteria bacterium RBG_16_57_12]